MTRLLTLCMLCAITFVAPAAPPGNQETVRLTLSEGTSMSAAVSPDGRTIVIDLLGALWTLDSSGGPATRILDDGYDAHAPVWSPDGTRIAFQAYRDATWNIWTINRDGSGLRRETSGPFDDREPHWSPDGTRIAFSSDRSGNYDVWTLTLSSHAVDRLTTSEANEAVPSWSPDGREIAYVSDRRARGIYAIALSGRRERILVSDARTIAGPGWRRDGQGVAYTAIDGPVSQLATAPTSTEPSAPRHISDDNEDVFPFRPQFTSGGEWLYTADGKIKSRPATGGPARIIEFSADVSFTRAAFTPRQRGRAPQGLQPVRGMMRPTISPDGTRIVFAALGDLWSVPATTGDVTPARLTDDPFVETDPAWSPDGTQLAFSSDRDGSMDLWIRHMESGSDRKLTTNAMSAAWSPDGRRIAFLDPLSQLQVVDVAGGQVQRAHDRLNEPGRPTWLPGGRAVAMGALRPYSTRYREGTNQILMVPIDTAGGTKAGAGDRWFNPLPHKSIGMREDFGPAWSPDGTMLAAIVDGYLEVLPIGAGGAPLGKPRRLSGELANAPSWTGDSRRVLYQHAGGFGVADVRDGRVRQITPRLSWTARETSGHTVVHAGRLFDGRSDTIRENVDVVINGNRIVSIDAHRSDLHTGRVVDATNQTVLPGLIESHAHLTKGYGEALGRIWLSFGITTVRNPASNPYESLEDREAIDSGRRLGPRVFSTGEPFDGTRIYYPGGSAVADDAQLTMRFARLHQLQFDFVKTYVRLPDLLQKRVIEEAHRLGLPVTSHEIYPAVAYGADGVEHIRGTSRRGYSPKMSELRRSYRDVIELLTASKMTLTPTIGIQGGFQVQTLRDGWWLDDVRLQQLFPPSALAAGRALRQAAPDAADLARRDALVVPQEKLVAAVVNGGGRVIAGTDSPINPYGLALIAELEHYVRGGASPAATVRSVTSVPAEAMGLAHDLGTIEAGKLADMVIVEGNPLVDITDLRKTRITVKDGVVYEVEALLRRAK